MLYRLLCGGVTAAMAITAIAQNPLVSTAKDSKGTSLTIYNQNFAVVREKRTISLSKGINVLRYEDVASQIDPTSLSFKSLTDPNGVLVREQNYQYDLLNPTSILNKSVGQRVRIRQPRPGGTIEVLEGVLLNPPSVTVANTDSQQQYGWYGGPQASHQGIAIRLDDGRIILSPVGEIEVAELPEGLVSTPSLLWRLDADRSGRHDTEVSYMANAITWKADYVAVVDKDEKKIDVTGWVTLDNRSGATYRDAALQLMAGDVRRVQEDAGMRRGGFAGPGGRAEAAFTEQAFFEYHLYTLDGTTTIRNNEQKQMNLLSAGGVGTTRKLTLDAGRQWWQYWLNYRQRPPGQGTDTEDVKVNIVIEVKNSKANNMGMALPKGKVRLYKADDRGSLQFLGEDLIDHTPKDETLRLYVGDSFDVKGTRKRTDFKQLAPSLIEEEFEVSVRNHKDVSANVWVVEHFYGDWEILTESHKHNKLDAHTAEFPITVPANSEVIVKYRSRTKW